MAAHCRWPVEQQVDMLLPEAHQVAEPPAVAVKIRDGDGRCAHPFGTVPPATTAARSISSGRLLRTLPTSLPHWPDVDRAAVGLHHFGGRLG
jgi:hypothetical protein